MSIEHAKEVLEQLPPNATKEELTAFAKSVKSVVILKTSWYTDIIDSLESSAKDYLKSIGVEENNISTVPVPGSYELPLGAQVAIEEKNPSFVVALGCIIQGQTPHFEVLCNSVAKGLLVVQLKTNCPVGFGVLTVGDRKQAEARKDRGSEAAQAALFMAYQFGKMKKNEPTS